MINVLLKINRLLCAYLGITNDFIRPQWIAIKNEQIVISITESHKHHIHKKKWDEISDQVLNKISISDKKKIGLALRAALAKNLIISFDEPIKQSELRHE